MESASSLATDAVNRRRLVSPQGVSQGELPFYSLREEQLPREIVAM